MTARTRITVLAAAAALALAIGIPVVALTVKPSTEVVSGTVLSVVPAERALLIRPGDGSRPQEPPILVHVPPGQQIQLPHGRESLDLLLPGQHVTARVLTRSLTAQAITASD